MNLNGYSSLIQSSWKDKLLFLAFFASEISTAETFADAEIGLQPRHRVFKPEIHVLSHRLARFILSSRYEHVDKILMPSDCGFIRIHSSHAEPRRSEGMYLLDRHAQCCTSRAFGNPVMQFFMRGQIKRMVGPGERVDTNGKLLRFVPVVFGCNHSKESRRLDLQRFPDDVVSPNVLSRWNAHARAGSGPAFQQPFELEPQKSL